MELKRSRNNVISAYEARITNIVVSTDGRLIASVSHDRYLRLWIPNGELIRSIFVDLSGVRTVFISPNQKVITTGRKNKISD